MVGCDAFIVSQENKAMHIVGEKKSVKRRIALVNDIALISKIGRHHLGIRTLGIA